MIGLRAKSLLILFILISGFILLGQIENSQSLAAFDIGNFKGTSGLNQTSVETGYSTVQKLQGSPETIVASVVKLFLSFLGVIFLILTIYGGFNWMLARGNEQKVDKAKNIITNSVIGLIVILAAYMIAAYISNSFSTSAI